MYENFLRMYFNYGYCFLFCPDLLVIYYVDMVSYLSYWSEANWGVDLNAWRFMFCFSLLNLHCVSFNVVTASVLCHRTEKSLRDSFLCSLLLLTETVPVSLRCESSIVELSKRWNIYHFNAYTAKTLHLINKTFLCQLSYVTPLLVFLKWRWFRYFSSYFKTMQCTKAMLLLSPVKK